MGLKHEIKIGEEELKLILQRGMKLKTKVSTVDFTGGIINPLSVRIVYYE